VGVSFLRAAVLTLRLMLQVRPFSRALPLVLLAYSVVSLLIAVLLHQIAPNGF
jgi:hypothetical protein